MPKQSAGILLFRFELSDSGSADNIKFFLVHPGGPFHKNRDIGAWSIPKGEFDNPEEPLKAALREFEEETGTKLEDNLKFIELTPVTQKAGKIVHAWACESDMDAEKIISNKFPFEFPPKSGKFIEIPEIDRGEWFDTVTAKIKINPAQVKLIEELKTKI
ncbi:NUDIX domain-containing protein [soil metagenome]